MLMFLLSMLIRLAFACFSLAIRLAFMLAALTGKLLGLSLVWLWRRLRRPRTTLPQLPASEPLPLQQHPSAAPQFIPRKLRPTSKR